MPIRKRLIPPASADTSDAARTWLPIQDLAVVEVTSEDPAHPIDSALVDDGGTGWRAAGPGAQVIRLLFDNPQTLTAIRLAFEDGEQERVQEFSLRWSADGGRTYAPIVRQQYTFSPGGATREVEEYTVQLRGVTAVELQIVPDISGRHAIATVREIRLR